jgi:hypothetical protein
MGSPLSYKTCKHLRDITVKLMGSRCLLSKKDFSENYNFNSNYSKNASTQARKIIKIVIFYHQKIKINKKTSAFAKVLRWRLSGSNRRPLACHASALPAELSPRVCGTK